MEEFYTLLMSRWRKCQLTSPVHLTQPATLPLHSHLGQAAVQSSHLLSLHHQLLPNPAHPGSLLLPILTLRLQGQPTGHPPWTLLLPGSARIVLHSQSKTNSRMDLWNRRQEEVMVVEGCGCMHPQCPRRKVVLLWWMTACGRRMTILSWRRQMLTYCLPSYPSKVISPQVRKAPGPVTLLALLLAVLRILECWKTLEASRLLIHTILVASLVRQETHPTQKVGQTASAPQCIQQRSDQNPALPCFHKTLQRTPSPPPHIIPPAALPQRQNLPRQNSASWPPCCQQWKRRPRQRLAARVCQRQSLIWPVTVCRLRLTETASVWSRRGMTWAVLQFASLQTLLRLWVDAGMTGTWGQWIIAMKTLILFRQLWLPRMRTSPKQWSCPFHHKVRLDCVCNCCFLLFLADINCEWEGSSSFVQLETCQGGYIL